jgi:hypothetical protein
MKDGQTTDSECVSCLVVIISTAILAVLILFTTLFWGTR